MKIGGYNNKLVRDKIPSIIEADDRYCETRILDTDEYMRALENKLDEEVEEFHESKEPEELADILEVVFALGAASNVSAEKLMRMMHEKRESRGGFAKRIFLISTSEKDPD